jgi:arginine decarboxylase-like protein
MSYLKNKKKMLKTKKPLALESMTDDRLIENILKSWNEQKPLKEELKPMIICPTLHREQELDLIKIARQSLDLHNHSPILIGFSDINKKS